MCVPPDFNETMKAVWERLWEAMPQSRKVSVTVKQLLQQYKERCQAERSQKKDKSPPALLPVSFAQAKDWLLQQQKAHSEAITVGTVNEAAREVVAELNCTLTEQPTSTVRLLEQKPCQAAPVIPPSHLSLGPDAVTNEKEGTGM